MWSFIIIDTSDNNEISNVIKYIKNSYKKPEIIICHNGKRLYGEPHEYVFDKGESIEEILNIVACICTNQQIVIIRDLTNYKQIKELTDKVTDINKIAYIKPNNKGFFYSIKSFFIKTVNRVFRQNIKLMDYGIIAYGKLASTAIKYSINPSTTTRTNNFVGVYDDSVFGKKSFSFKYNKPKTILAFCVPLIMLILTILARVIIKNKLSIIANIGFGALIILELVFAVLFGLIWFIKLQIGDNELKGTNVK